MPNPRGKTAPPAPSLKGKTASMPNSTTHSGGGAPRQIMAGVRKGRTSSYEHAPASKGRKGSQQ